MNSLLWHRWGFVMALGALVVVGCTEQRDLGSPPLVFDDVNPILEESCVQCHGETDPAAGYSVEDYWRTIRCIPDPEGQPATLPSDETAPILAVLEQPDHAGLLDTSETEALTTWVVEGAMPSLSLIHI